MTKAKNHFNRSSREAAQKEPIIRIVKRDEISVGKRMLVRAVALLAALVVVEIFLCAVTKFDPFTILSHMFKGTFRNKIAIMAFLKEIAMLLCISLALAPAFKMRFWNIGAQGQVLMGALLTAVCMVYLGGKMPNAILIVLMFVISLAAGAIWAAIPAFFKVKWNTNETLFTLMMNYIAIQIVSSCIEIWKGQNSALGILNRDTEAGYLPNLFGNPYILSILLVAILTVGMFFYLKKTKQGYEIAVVGESLNTAKYAGIGYKKVIIRTMLISGAICGLAGLLYVAGQNHTIAASTGGGYGFTAIIVAWAAGFNPFIMALISVLIVFLTKGGAEVSNKSPNINSYVSDIVVGVFLFFLIGCEFFLKYKIIPSAELKASLNKFAAKFKKTEKAVKTLSEGGEQ